MSRKYVLLSSLLLVVAGLVVVGCSLTDPEDVEAPLEPIGPAPLKAAYSTTLVPNGDIYNNTWIGFPDTLENLWSLLDEGLPNSPDGEFIYALYYPGTYRCEFTDMPTGTDLDISAIEVQTDASMGTGGAWIIWLDMSVYINDVLVDTERFECGEMPNIECNTLDISHTFDGLCFDAADVNTLEVAFAVGATYWYPGSTSANIGAVDVIVHYDNACDPQIQDLEVLRHGNNFAVIWDTPCDATSEVIWGYSPDALTNSVTGGAGTHHIRNFTVADDQGCVYLKAIATGTTCSALADTSALQTKIKEVVISNVVRTFDPFNCEFVVTWDTNVKSSSKVYWGTGCSALNNTATGGGNTTSHTVTIDAVSIPYKTRLITKPESASGCDTAVGSCGSTTRNYCILRLK